MENLDKGWQIASTIAITLIALFNVLLANLKVPAPGEPVPGWRKAILIVVNILGRVFGATTVANRGNKEGAELKVPIFQSAMPNKVPPPKV